jgi:hypothetical protein
VPAKAQIPLIAIKRLGAVGVMFGLYTAASGAMTTAELTGLAVGLLYGLTVAWRVSDRQPATRLVGATAAGVLVAAVVSAMPLRNIADVAPEITRVVAAEKRTTVKYRAANEAFKKGKISAEALAQVADRAIVTELQAIDARLSALTNVPPEHQGIVADAREYLQLRAKSWRARAEIVRRTHPDPRKSADPRPTRAAGFRPRRNFDRICWRWEMPRASSGRRRRRSSASRTGNSSRGWRLGGLAALNPRTRTQPTHATYATRRARAGDQRARVISARATTSTAARRARCGRSAGWSPGGASRTPGRRTARRTGCGTLPNSSNWLPTGATNVTFAVVAGPRRLPATVRRLLIASTSVDRNEPFSGPGC